MKTGKIISDLRKEKSMSQTELANKTGVSQVMVGKYEKGDASPSIEVAKKIADTLEVSLDYLVGEGMNVSFDKATLQRLQNVHKLSNPDKDHVYALPDAFLLKCDIQKNFAKS